MNNLKIDREYPYIYETHLHTNQASACAHNTGREMAQACHAAGYTGMIVTDHFFYGNSCIDRTLPWKDWVEAFCRGYEDAAEEGARLGLQVFFGWESNYDSTEFLIFGLDKEWLLSHPQIRDASIEEQYQLVSEAGGMVIHAHPFRKEDYIPEIRLFPDYVDGVEGANATHASKKSQYHNQPLFDVQAREYAAQYNLPMTAGSDIHSKDLFLGGMAFPHRLRDIRDFIAAVKGREDYRLLDGN